MLSSISVFQPVPIAIGIPGRRAMNSLPLQILNVVGNQMKLSKPLKYFIASTSILAVVLLTAAYFGHKKNVDSPLTKLYVLAFNGNDIKIYIDNKIDKDKLKIEDNLNNDIFSNGKLVGNIANEYGDTYFNFYYDKQLFAVAGLVQHPINWNVFQFCFLT